jgi:quercetin dioxygenase-like cupin family protein
MSQSPIVTADPRTFRAYFDKRPFVLDTSLASHPLLSLERIIELARRLPERFVEYNAGELPVSASPVSPRNGLSAEETLERIETCKSWMVLKRVERDPAFGALMDAFLDALDPLIREQVDHTFDRQGFLFVSSPGSVTPFHIDPEHNFLVQIRGTKTVSVWDPEDRVVISEQDLEAFHSAFNHRNLRYEDWYQHTAHTIPLQPGQALHFPVTAPHWVKNGPEVSISLSLTFRSDASQRRELLYRANAQLRRMGLSPRPVGDSRWGDAVKLLGANTWLLAREAAQLVQDHRSSDLPEPMVAGMPAKPPRADGP